MTIIPASYYSLDPTAKTITFSAPYDSISAEEILSIRNLSKQIKIYDSEDPRHYTLDIIKSDRTQDFDIEITDSVLTYVANTGMENTDVLQIVIGWNVIDGGTP